MPAQAPKTIVHKFGGAALADASAIERVAELIAADTPANRRVVVTSALQGITNELIGAIDSATREQAQQAREILDAAKARHLGVATRLLPKDTGIALNNELLQQFAGLDLQFTKFAIDSGNRARHGDAILATGERLAASILAAVLNSKGVPAVVVDGTQLIITDGRYGNANPDLTRTDAKARTVIGPLLDEGKTIVVPGFFGSGPDGSTTTLGRGGSDLTAAILARALDATEVILWKDVPGVMTADPRIVNDARVVPLLDAREASELAYYGAKVLHPRTLFPLRAGTTLKLKPFADPSASGTTIVVGKVAPGAPVRAISGITKQAMVAVNGTGMLGVPGVAARVFGALAPENISVSLISQASSEQSICFTIPADRAEQVTRLLRAAFADQLARFEIDEISVRKNLTTIAVVGSGMARMPGISARIFAAVADAGANVVAIAQGASERNVSFVVEEHEADAAMRAVHAKFHLGKVGGGKAPRRHEPADVILLGMGRVAQELAMQLAQIARRKHRPMRITGIIDRSGFVHYPRGMTPRQIESLVVFKQGGGSVANAPNGRVGTALAAVNFIASHALTRPVLVDVASGDTAAALAGGVAHGMDLVLANKVPLASGIAWTREILHEARANGRRVLHEATVGAGLPLIDTLQQLHASGDRVDSVDSSPSGTMGFLFSEMGRGRPFSEVVLDAMLRGYTEPDPRDDLSGIDIARKGIILARMLGYSGEMSDVVVESLVPENLRNVSRAQFIEALLSCDAEWQQRIAEARGRGEVLRYRARATRGGVRVGLASVSTGTALAALDGTDNLFVITTARYRDRPLVISGPGAGVEVTAAGVLGDLMRLVSP